MLRYVDFGLFRVTAQLFFTQNIKYLFEIAFLVLILCVRVSLCGTGWRSANLLLQLFLCGSFILGLLNNIYTNMLNAPNVYRIPASAVNLNSSRCCAPRVEKKLRSRNSRTIYYTILLQLAAISVFAGFWL